MCGARLLLAATALQALILAVSCGHRRSVPTQATAPISKSGWRPVVGSGGIVYSFGGPVHAPSYKIPVPVLDYQSSARPLSARDATKLSSIAQSYRPTTLRTVATQSPHVNQPINSYHNPYVLNNGLSYKYIQNIPLDTSYIRNPHNPFARPVFSKYPTKFKQQAQNNALQQLTSLQPNYFGQYQTPKPTDVFGKPINDYVSPNVVKNSQAASMEIFKPEVYKLPDTNTASQSVSQQVKTAQQQNFGPQTFNHFPQYTFQEAALPHSILGAFGNFGIQTYKGHDPVYPNTKQTLSPAQTQKQTIFNSFSYNPNYKSTPNQFISTTPRLQTTANFNNNYFVSTLADYKVTPPPSSKVATAPKIDPNAGAKDSFKPSPQDPFSKNYATDFNKVTTYNPVQTTTTANAFYEYSFPPQQASQLQNYFDQQNANYNYEQKKQNVNDNVASSVNQHSNQYEIQKVESGAISNSPRRPTYEVIETTEPEVNTHSSSASWTLTSPSYANNDIKSTEQSFNKEDYDGVYTKPTTTPLPQLPDEYAIENQPDKSLEHFFNYDGQVESQSRRPLGDDFEPIGKHKLKDYYYRVSTPAYNEQNAKRTKNPSDATRVSVSVETSTSSSKDINGIPLETLPTLPPNRHFKRPSSSEPLDKDRIRKRNKIRRRRPIGSRSKEEISTRPNIQTSEIPQTTEVDEVHTIRPRIRPTYQPNTTPTVTTDSTTSGLPTITPTVPGLIKKKLVHRRPITTTERAETTTSVPVKEDSSKESSIMKITSRPQFPKLTPSVYEIPDYSHKQDEKDTPTSDVAVSINDSYKNSVKNVQEFSFHKDVKPIEAKLEPVTNQRYRETTTEQSSEFDTNGEVTTTIRPDTTSVVGNGQRPRLRNKYNRPKFSVKDYRNRMGSTSSTTEKPVENTPKLRYSHRRVPYNENLNTESETTTEKKRFTPKDPRHKPETDLNEEKEKEIHSIRQHSRQRHTTSADEVESTSPKISARIRNGLRRPRPTEETTETTSQQSTVHHRRPLRKKIKDSEIGESVQDFAVTETTPYEVKNEITSERTRSESAIMKIADKKHHENVENLFEHSKRVSDLTLAASKDYNKPGMFKTLGTNSRRIPNYFTIATDDPILPIEAFFPQLNQKKDS